MTSVFGGAGNGNSQHVVSPNAKQERSVTERVCEPVNTIVLFICMLSDA
jgi:hypothetical protein